MVIYNTNKTRSQERKKYKLFLSLLSIAVLILIVLLLPRPEGKKVVQEPPRTAVRFVPAPTPSPGDEIISVRSQLPGNTLRVTAVVVTNPSFIVVELDEEILFTSEMFAETVNNLDIPLGREIADGEVLTIKLYGENEKLVFEKEVLMTTTALAPGVILPKDLQN